MSSAAAPAEGGAHPEAEKKAEPTEHKWLRQKVENGVKHVKTLVLAVLGGLLGASGHVVKGTLGQVEEEASEISHRLGFQSKETGFFAKTGEAISKLNDRASKVVTGTADYLLTRPGRVLAKRPLKAIQGVWDSTGGAVWNWLKKKLRRSGAAEAGGSHHASGTADAGDDGAHPHPA